MALNPLDPGRDIRRHRNHLPHWHQDGTTCFVTFRLGDSVPEAKLRLWKHERECWMQAHGLSAGHDTIETLPEEKRHEYHRRFTARFHAWLDAGYGQCCLRRPDCARIVSQALGFFDGERYALDAWVVMPNHVHVLVTPCEGHDLSAILHSWKSYTSKQLNGIMERCGPLWQQESYDHLVRSEEQFAHYRRYIRDNPVKAKLREAEFLWWDSLGDPYAPG